MTSSTDESSLERVTLAVMRLTFWAASVTLAVGLALWLALPAGDHGAVQADMRLDIIDARARYPIASSTVLGASLSVGWSHKF